MDTKQLIEQAKFRYNHQQSRQALESKYQSQLNLIYGGGMWDITTELLSLLTSLTVDSFILTDSYNKPIQVNVPEMRELAFEKYNEVMGAWLAEHNELSKIR